MDPKQRGTEFMSLNLHKIIYFSLSMTNFHINRLVMSASIHAVRVCCKFIGTQSSVAIRVPGPDHLPGLLICEVLVWIHFSHEILQLIDGDEAVVILIKAQFIGFGFNY